MIITNVTGNVFLKENDTATEMHLAIQEVDGTAVDLSSAVRVEVAIGTLEGRYLTKTPTLLDAPGELTFGLDEGDMLPVGDNLLEVYIYDAAGEKRVAPSKGHYKLRIQQSLGSLGLVVTTYTLEYFLGEVNRILFGLPQLLERGNALADRMDELIDDSEQTLDVMNTTIEESRTATTESIGATIASELATQAAQQATTEAEQATVNAIQATDAANTATTEANEARDDANIAASLADGIATDLLGYNSPISNFSLATRYIKHQHVRDNGSTYRAKVETQGNPLPVAPATSNAWFDLVSKKGDKGDAGTSLKPLGVKNDVSELPPTGNEPGDAYLVGQNMYMWDDGQWNDVGPIIGPQGEQGIQGDIGTGIEYVWDGTRLGVKREDEASFSYRELKGAKGDKGDNAKIISLDFVIPATDALQFNGNLITIRDYMYDPAADSLQVYQNSRILYPGEDFELENGNIRLASTVVDPASTTFYVQVTRSVSDIDPVQSHATVVGALGYTPARSEDITQVVYDLEEVDTRLATQLDDFISVSRFGETKDSATIQAALNFAKNMNGATIIIPTGIYNVMSPIRVPSNTKLIAEGHVVLKRMADISAIMFNDSDGLTGSYGANMNIYVEGIIFDANNQVYTGNATSLAFGHTSNIVVTNCEFINCNTWHDLEVNSSKKVLIDNCSFKNYYGTSEALQLDFCGAENAFPWFGPWNDDTACKDITVNRCSFEKETFDHNDSTVKAIGNHSFKTGVVTKNVKIINCEFKNYTQTINLQDVISLTVEGCYFTSCLYGIVFAEQTTPVGDWNLIDNYFNFRPFTENIEGRFFHGSTTAPVFGLYSTKITGNYIENAGWNAIGITANTMIIKNNHILASGGRGIYIYGGNDIVITDNIVQGSVMQDDIVIGNNAGVVTKNVILSNNKIGKVTFGNNISNVICMGNIISTSVNNTSSVANVNNNIVANVWTP